ncbi:MAG: penicillin-insensitive murein endopeptidase [Bacteroidetes bacterium]|nr:penicillin-insensitive murein endopeptidase [Bacteroidota bacterium]
MNNMDDQAPYYLKKKGSNDDQNPLARKNSKPGQNSNSELSSFKIQAPTISLPKGGGGIKSIDEKFTINAVNGTAALSIPIPISSARGFSPDIRLAYNSGSGNNLFGLGWSLNIPSIRRKTEKELPRYLDASDSDTYILDGAEDLVPAYQKNEKGEFVIDNNGAFVLHEYSCTFFGTDYTVRRYIPRTEGTFSTIERWTEKTTGYIHWRIISKENITSLLGKSASSRIADPANDKNIFEWHCEFSYDDKNNCSLYEYKPENKAGLDASLLHNRNRSNGNAPFSNTYLKRIWTGIRTPYLSKGEVYPKTTDFLFETVFDYGEHDKLKIPFDEKNPWTFRSDAFSFYKPGFEIRTCRLCSRILLYHHFDELPEGNALVKSLDLHYEDNGIDGFTFLKTATLTGYTKHDDKSYTFKACPPFGFDYQPYAWNFEVKKLQGDQIEGAPVGIDNSSYQFTDLYGEGLSGILTEQGNGWFYKHNLGKGNFSPSQLVISKPSLNGLGGSLQLTDLDADGFKQIVSLQNEPRGFFEINDDNSWESFTTFDAIPNIDFNDPNTKQLDLNGDGMADLLITQDQLFKWYPSAGKKGYDLPNYISRQYDEEKGPSIIFADTTQTIFLADMSGDGLTDIVRIRNGEVNYWPNLGFGKFGAKVGMDNAPLFDHEDLFDPSLLRLADIDGSGTTDIIYLGQNKLRIWLNKQGNSFTEQPVWINPFPDINKEIKISVADLLGTGLSCICWSSPLPNGKEAPLRYIDLMSSKKPHILTRYANNLGKEVILEYTPSTKFYVDDKLAGSPWVTKLHFPVQCLSKTTTYDRIRKTRLSTEYSYHHGYYDHAEREFRGFGRVDQKDSEEIFPFIEKSTGASNNPDEKNLLQPPILIRTWFHTGAFLNEQKLLSQFSNEYFKNLSVPECQLPEPVLDPGLNLTEYRQALRACKGFMLRKEIYALDGSNESKIPYTTEQHNCVIKLLQPTGTNKYAVFISHESEGIKYNYERIPSDPRTEHKFILAIDDYGNVLESADVYYTRLSRPLAPDAIPNDAWNEQNQLRILCKMEKFTNAIEPADATDPDFTNHRVPLTAWKKSFELTGVPITPGNYFLLNDIKTAFDSAVAIDFDVATDGSPQKRLLGFDRTQYRGNDTVSILPFEKIESKALLHISLQAAFNNSIIQNILGAKISLSNCTTLLTDHLQGGYQFADGYFWISSGTKNYDAAHFYNTTEIIDSFGNKTTVDFDSKYSFYIETITDALTSTMIVKGFNYRTLSPYLIQDINENISGVRFDDLGMPVRLILMGKKGAVEGDVMDLSKVEINHAIDQPTVEFTYSITEWSSQAPTLSVDDLFQFKYIPRANFVRTDAYEVHFNTDPSKRNKKQVSYSYNDGSGKEILVKMQAEPGPALKINAGGTVTLIPDTTPNVRWIGTGRTILNNKGNPVKQYEPYYSADFVFEDETDVVQLGVTKLIHYDPVDRVVQTDFPNGTFTTSVFNPWKQINSDANDNTIDSDWYKLRTGTGALATDPQENDAALKASIHDGSPSTQFFDNLGRVVVVGEINKYVDPDTGAKVEEKYFTYTKLDIQGNKLIIKDARNNPVVQYDYNLLKQIIRQTSMDTGVRWMITDAEEKPLRKWDERNFEFSYLYDELNRPKISHINGGDGTKSLNNDFDKIIYGESIAAGVANNLRGRPAFHYDTAGRIEFKIYDFKANILSSNRRFCTDYVKEVDWSGTALDAKLDLETFFESTNYDALNRITDKTTADGSVTSYLYNESGLLKSIGVLQNGTTIPAVKNIRYDAKGQRLSITNGSDVTTNYAYDSETFRLTRLTSQPLSSDTLQDLLYTYDPSGNITCVRDEIQPVIFYKNQKVELKNLYDYDSLYRIIMATGREHDVPINSDGNDNWNDQSYFQPVNSPNNMQLRNYKQTYHYDFVGNVSSVQHNKGQASAWLRTYTYPANSNRLTGTQIGALNYSYTPHPKHGYIMKMPHLSLMDWNFLEQLKATAQQAVNTGTPMTTYYVYDFRGERVRKITTASSQQEGIPPMLKQRLYLAEAEFYREYNAAGINLERQTLNVTDDKTRVLLTENLVKGNDGSEKSLLRYQLGNHLASVSLEVTKIAGALQVISYEEYFPFGNTSYQASNQQIKSAAKRYRYIGKERDEESGFNYHSARYYIPWLGRWACADPSGLVDGPNVYVYSQNSPVSKSDTRGLQTDTDEVQIDEAQQAKDWERLQKTTLPAIRKQAVLEDVQYARQNLLNLLHEPYGTPGLEARLDSAVEDLQAADVIQAAEDRAAKRLVAEGSPTKPDEVVGKKPPYNLLLPEKKYDTAGPFVELPEEGEGYQSLKKGGRFGRPEVVAALQNVGRLFHARHPDLKFYIGDINDPRKKSKGKSPHRSHTTGVDVDIHYQYNDPKKTKGQSTIYDEDYSRALSQELIDLIVNESGTPVEAIFSDDQQLRNTTLVYEKHKNDPTNSYYLIHHHDHFHVRFQP